MKNPRSLIPLVHATIGLLGWLATTITHAAAPPCLPGTQALTATGDLAASMVTGISQYLDRQRAEQPARRADFWRVETNSSDGFLKSWFRVCDTNRVHFRKILGVADSRDPVRLQYANFVTGAPAAALPIGRGEGYHVYAVTWNVFRSVTAEGLLLQPDQPPKADIIAVPDCDQTPEQIAGLAPGLPAENQFARRFAEYGCRVIIPCLVSRTNRLEGPPGARPVEHSPRETLWRAGYEMGRTLIGYEILKVLAAADWLEATRSDTSPLPHDLEATIQRVQNPAGSRQQLGIVGYGEGGLIAFYAGALDMRFQSVAVCGYFGPRERLAEEPIYRNVWSLGQRFGDAEIARLVMPRALFLEHGAYPEVLHTDQRGGAPGRLGRPASQPVDAEYERIGVDMPHYLLRASPQTICDWATAGRFYRCLVSQGGPLPQTLGPLPQATGALPPPREREQRQFRQILEDTQGLMRESEYVRRAFWRRADTSSASAFTNSAAWYRDYFHDEIIGRLPRASLPPNPRSRFLYETNGYRGYEVMLDVHPEVFAYGILLMPSVLQPGEKRPVVVCQHGLEGRPRDVADPALENPAYHRFACQLAERGFITFSPQNPYIGGTRFRQVLRQAQPLGLTLYSFIVRQHEVITDWLAAQDFVDPQRIAFYGLSYGGKTAMRAPALVDRYCLSICSADYNEWIWKNVSARSPYSYLWTGEYDMPEFNLGNTFNYAELSWLIFPRPFMVERGHDDGVAPDEWVAYEYAKTRRHYVKLGLGARTEIEFFNGPHSINGIGTFAFLHHHLNWPETSPARPKP